jgi:hypothetical protein
VDFAGPLCRLHDDLRESVEERTPGLLVAFLAVWIAVADADERACSRNLEADEIIGGRNGPALLVESFDLKDGDVFAIGVDFVSVHGQPDGNGRAGGFALFRQHHLPAFRRARLDCAGLVPGLPFNVAEMRHFLAAQALAVDEQLNFFEIGVDPNRNLVAFPALEIPVREYVQRRLGAPPRLVVVADILGKPAHVYDAELRTDRRPPIGSRLAAIVEACPRKAACHPVASAIEFPPLFSGFAPRHHAVVRIHEIAQRIGCVHAARADRA